MMRLRATKHQRMRTEAGRQLRDDARRARPRGRAGAGARRDTAHRPRRRAPRPAGPSVSSAPWCAAASTPSAKPDTTGTPAAARPRPSARRDLQPVRRRRAERPRPPPPRRRRAPPDRRAMCRTAGGSGELAQAAPGTPRRSGTAIASAAPAARLRAAAGVERARSGGHCARRVERQQRRRRAARARRAGPSRLRHSMSSVGRARCAAMQRRVRRRQPSQRLQTAAGRCGRRLGGRHVGLQVTPGSGPARPSVRCEAQAAAVTCSGPTPSLPVEVGDRSRDAEDAAVASRAEAVAVVELVEQAQGRGRGRGQLAQHPRASSAALQVAPEPASRRAWRSRAAITRSRTSARARAATGRAAPRRSAAADREREVDPVEQRAAQAALVAGEVGRGAAAGVVARARTGTGSRRPRA